MLIAAATAFITFYFNIAIDNGIETHVSDYFQGDLQTVVLNNNYYHVQNSAMYKLNSNKFNDLVYEFPDNSQVIIKSYNDQIWAYVFEEKPCFYVFDKSCDLIELLSVSFPDKYYLSDFTIDNSGKIYCIVNIDLMKMSVIELVVSDGQLTENKLKFDKICEDDNCIISKYNESPVVCYKISDKSDEINKTSQYSVFNSTNNEWIHSIMDGIYDSDNSSVSYLFLNKNTLDYVYQPLNNDNKKVISQSTNNIIFPTNLFFYQNDKRMITIYGEYNYPTSSIEYMKDHRHDILTIYDIDENEISKEYKTRRHERIIYSDDKKAVTYYKGKYLFRSINDWSVISKLTADEIKRGGSYSFDSCGDYIFVFDTESGELLNKVNIS